VLAELIAENGIGALRVRFKNETSTTQWLAKPRALVEAKPDSGFLLTDPRAPYRGRILKRLPYDEQELIEVPGGQEVVSDAFDLRDYYAVREGTSVTVQYAASHPLAGVNQVSGPLTRIESHPVELHVPVRTE